MRDSDWSREILLRSDWSGLIGASYTTGMTDFFLQREIKRESYIQSYIRSAKMPGPHIQIGLNYEPVHPPPPPPTTSKKGVMFHFA